MWHGNQIAGIHGKLLISPGCLKQSYTCASVVDRKKIMQTMLATTVAEVL